MVTQLKGVERELPTGLFEVSTPVPFTGGAVEAQRGHGWPGVPRPGNEPNPLPEAGSLFKKATALLAGTLEWGRGNKEGHSSETEWDPRELPATDQRP